MTAAYTLSEGVLASHTVLVAALASLEDSSLREEALRLVRESYDRGDPVTRVEDIVVRCAQAKILGEHFKAPSIQPVKNPADRRTFETLAVAWIEWVAGGDPSPFVDSILKPTEYGGALHLMALEPWGRAITALSEDNQDEAVRWFRRSIEFGAQNNIETSDAIQWSYVASIFHRGT